MDEYLTSREFFVANNRCQRPLFSKSDRRLARAKIDEMLIVAGWIIQDYRMLNLGVGRGIAVREVPFDSGRCDYLLLVERVLVGAIEATKRV